MDSKTLTNDTYNQYTHVGWIPCVTGHLDFGLTKVGLDGDTANGRKRDKNKITVNFSSEGNTDNNARKVVLSSWVNWRDKLKGDGQFNVILAAKTNPSSNLDERHLSGYICIA